MDITYIFTVLARETKLTLAFVTSWCIHTCRTILTGWCCSTFIYISLAKLSIIACQQQEVLLNEWAHIQLHS